MRVETTVDIVEKEGRSMDGVKINGRWYVQKSLCTYRQEAIDRLAKIGPFGDVTEITAASELGIGDKKWTRYIQGITFDEENIEQGIAAKLFKDKDAAKLLKLEKEKKDIGVEKKKTIGMDRQRLMNTGGATFKVSDIYFAGDLDDKDIYKENEEAFRDFADALKAEVGKHVRFLGLIWLGQNETQFQTQ